MSKYLMAWMALLLFAAPAMAGDWPRLLGPDQNNISKETGLAKTWPAAGPKVLWTVPVGEGFGGATIEKGKAYILDRVQDKQDNLRCLDLVTGKEEWNYAYDAPGRTMFPGSHTLPTIDKDYIFTFGPFGDIHCIDKQTHKSLWHKNLEKDFGASGDQWKYTQAPLLYQDNMIVAPVSSFGGVIALKKTTGEVAWKSPALKGKIGHASPILATIGGVDQVIMVTGSGAAAVGATDGKLLWTWFGEWNCNIPIASAQPVGDGRVIITGEYGAGTAMLKVKNDGEKFTVEKVFLTKECQSQIHQPLILNGYFYANSNGNSANNGLLCMDLDGHLKWKTGRNPSFGRGALMLADGMIYMIEGEKGDLVMIKPNPEKYEEVARAKVLDGKQIWGPMALSDGKLVIRDQKQMKCLDIKNP